MATDRVMTREEALQFFQTAGEYRRGEREFPPHILQQQVEIKAAVRNAERFVRVFRVVDQGMVNDIVRLKLELEQMYVVWGLNPSYEQ